MTPHEPVLEVFDFEKILKESKETFQTIHLKEPQEQAQYADPELKKSRLQVARCRERAELLKDRTSDIAFETWTTTDVGNMAHYAVFSPVENKTFLKVLKEYRTFREDRPCFEKPIPNNGFEWSDALQVLLDMIKTAIHTDPLEI